MTEERGLFPELSRSYKVVFGVQVFACLLLVVVAGLYTRSWVVYLVAFSLDLIKDCFVVTAMIRASNANRIAEETRIQMEQRRSQASVVEGRLLNRLDMEPMPTLEIDAGPGTEDKW